MIEVETGAGCKACSIAPLDDELVRSLAYQMDLMPSEQVSREEYERRISLCAQCSSFMPRYTCLMNGAIVHILALKKKNSCPHPDKKW